MFSPTTRTHTHAPQSHQAGRLPAVHRKDLDHKACAQCECVCTQRENPSLLLSSYMREVLSILKHLPDALTTSYSRHF